MNKENKIPLGLSVVLPLSAIFGVTILRIKSRRALDKK